MSIRRVFMSTINYSHPQLGMIHAMDTLFGRDNVRNYDYFQRTREGRNNDFINGEFYDDVIRFKPDWLWLQLQNTDIIQAETLTKIEKALPDCVITHWCGDVRKEVGAYYASVCQATHLTLVANGGFIPDYLAAGAREVRYMAHGLDWNEDVLGVPDWAPPFQVPDVVYCGNHYGESMVGSDVRQNCVRMLCEAGINVGVIGNGWEKTGLPVVGQCHVKRQLQVYRKAKLVLGVNHFPELTKYHGDRTIIALASGTPVLQRWYPGIEEEFREWEDLWYFKDESLVEKAKILLDSELLRKELGRRGRAAAIRSHTWFTRILDVLSRVEEIQGKLLESSSPK